MNLIKKLVLAFFKKLKFLLTFIYQKVLSLFLRFSMLSKKVLIGYTCLFCFLIILIRIIRDKFFEEQTFEPVSFDEIVGLDLVKKEFAEIFLFLFKPEIFTAVGAIIPKGVLLTGPPGTGKTLLGKALASISGAAFFYVPGTYFTQSYVGGGAAFTRELFEEATNFAPSIIFIDEIDAIGGNRDMDDESGEREHVLNQLLSEMDGFDENKGVIVIGATNRPESLDPALIRPGRFSRHIPIGLPNFQNRINILIHHSMDKIISNEAFKAFAEISLKTSGFSGAGLANLLNEAALLAVRNNQTNIKKDNLIEAVDRMRFGIAGPKMKNTKGKFLIAYHEVGHAVIGSFLPYHKDVEKISLIPRGEKKGFTVFKNDIIMKTLFSRSELCSIIIAKLGGYVTEKIVFGETDITARSQDDLQELTHIARLMVTRYGMSSIGPIALENESDEMESGMKNRVDDEVRKIINYCEKIATKIILDNRIVIDLIVDKLVEMETLEGNELRDLIEEYTILGIKK